MTYAGKYAGQLQILGRVARVVWQGAQLDLPLSTEAATRDGIRHEVPCLATT